MRTPEDFDEFYASTARRVLLHVYAVCGDLGDAQDITQEAYARAWQQWAAVAEYEHPELWVRKVAWRLAANRWRGLRRWLAAQTRHGPGEDTEGPSPERIAVLSAMRRLPETQRHAIAMHYLLDMPVQEIAESTGVPSGTAKARLARGRAALAPLLKDEEAVDARRFP
jgi:RNA polymerase sigma-70 factor (ECF subfamily)